MEDQKTILEGYSDLEKGAYLGAIAALATADRLASEEELEFIETLIESAQITHEQAALIRHAATTEISDDDLKKFLDVLKTSELRYSLVSDVIAFAQSDDNYTEAEEHKVEEIAKYLNVNQQQLSVLDQFTKKAVQEAPHQAEEAENSTPNSFLDSLGFGDKLKSAGINPGNLFKGALGVIGPILLAKMLTGRRSGGGGLLGGLMGGGGGLLGGMMGGGGGLLGGLMGGNRGGGLGGLLGGGRGFGGAGGLLGRIFGR